MKKRMLAMALVLMMVLPLLLAGCQSAPAAPEETSPAYKCLPHGDDASFEEMMTAAIEKIKEVTGRKDEPLGFEITHSAVPSGPWDTSGTWDFRLAYDGGDVYAVNVDSTTCEVRTIVLLPESYTQAWNDFHGASIAANDDAELVYSKNEG